MVKFFALLLPKQRLYETRNCHCIEAVFVFNQWMLSSTYSIWNRVQKVFAGETMAVKTWAIWIPIFKCYIIAIIFYIPYLKETDQKWTESSQEGWILSLEKAGFLNSQCKIAMSLSTSITSWAVIQYKGCVNLQLHWRNPQIK